MIDKSRNYIVNGVNHIVSRAGNRVRVYAIEGGKDTPLRTVKDTAFATVSAAKAFMANPSL